MSAPTHPSRLPVASARVRGTALAAVGLLVALVALIAPKALPAQAAATLLSQGKPTTASSTENAGTPAADATDGNAGTRWSSAFADPQWLEVDLGSVQSISQVVLQWETAYATAYQIQTSTDGSAWTSIYATTTGTGGTQTVNVTGSGRYVRMYGTARATAYGYSLWEFQVFGGTTTPPMGCGTTDVAQGRTATASSTENAGTPAADAVDGNAGTRWSSAASDPQWLQVDLGSAQSICGVTLTWETAYGSAFQLQTSNDATTWTSIYSTTSGTGGTQALTVSGSGRYLRMYGTVRATQYGYSLWELAVFTGTTTTSTGPTTSPPPVTTTPAGGCNATDAALNHLVTVSSTENAGTGGSLAVDGDSTTRWSSAASDPQWIEVDLGATQTICGVTLTWEAAYAKSFQLQTSNDGTTWTSIYSTTTGAGGTQTLTVTGTGRYLRMYGTVRATAYGYSLWELAVFTTTGGTVAPTSPPPSGPAPGNCPWVNSTAPIATRVAQVIAAMTQDQKVALLHGDTTGSPFIGNLDGQPALCIPALHLEDGPNGVGDGLGGVTQMPVAVAGASTWDTALEQQYGSATGAEFAGKGANVELGPTLNIDRDPRWGRGFETFSEDPYLTGQMASADIQGIQSQGVMAEAKHVAVYNQETNRNGPADDAIVDDKTLQEIYLPGFQETVDKGATASVMCGYSTVNGTFDCENPYLLNTALYQQAGFTGFVTSDWGAAHSTVPAANSGMTLEMPGGYFYDTFLTQALAAGTVSQATLNTMVGRILTKMFTFGLFDHPSGSNTTGTVTTTAHVATSRQVEQEGTVLLKNNGILPLSAGSLSSIAIIGDDGGAGVHTSGGGSGNATSSGTVWPLTGITTRAGAAVTTKFQAVDTTADIATAVTLAKASSVAIVFVDDPEQEGTDLTDIDLPGVQNSLVSQVAAANPKTIVVMDTGGPVTMPWLSSVAGVFEEWYGGQQVGTSIASLLFGDVNPSGKLPVTFPNSLNDVPANTAAQWPGTNNTVQYSEGVDVGYRWYDAKNITPAFPFGYGLSYTSFAFSNLTVGPLGGNGTATVTATVKNTGAREGADTAQLYLTEPAAANEPPKQLKGFARVDLAAGASQTVSFTLSAHDLADWVDGSGGWTVPPGTYTVSVGDSSRRLPLTGTISVGTQIAGAAAESPDSPLFTVDVVNPAGMSSPAGSAASLTVTAHDTVAGRTLSFSASGLPAGLSISAAGVISGTPTTKGSTTVTVTATDNTGVAGRTNFVWTTT